MKLQFIAILLSALALESTGESIRGPKDEEKEATFEDLPSSVQIHEADEQDYEMRLATDGKELQEKLAKLAEAGDAEDDENVSVSSVQHNPRMKQKINLPGRDVASPSNNSYDTSIVGGQQSSRGEFPYYGMSQRLEQSPPRQISQKLCFHGTHLFQH